MGKARYFRERMDPSRLKIDYVTVDDPLDRRSWSGINNFLLKALEARVEKVHPIGPLRPQPTLFAARLLNQFLLRIFKKRWNYRDSFLLSRAYARVIRSRSSDRDMVVAPAGLSTVAHLQGNSPVVYINDRCSAGALDYHLILSGLAEASRRESLALEQRTLDRADLVIYSSHWAADAAKKASPRNAEKIRMIPFGANLLSAPPPPEPKVFPPKRLKLLMLGVYWESKGGPIAYAALQELKQRGQEAELVVCGCDPPAELQDPDLIREGFLNKNIAADMERLIHHLRTADFLILPTRFEAYGLVFCEAAAYGLPVLASRTGGVPTIVEDGRTGYLFDLEANGSAYADRIQELIAEPERWQAMRKAARARYEEVLNWDAFVTTLLDHIEASGLVNKDR